MDFELEAYPFVRLWKNRHGVDCWRFRRKPKGGKEISKIVPGEPGSQEFDDAYQALIAGLPIADRRIVRRNGEPSVQRDPDKVVHLCKPKTFADAWRLVRERGKWQALDQKTKKSQGPAVEHFLTMRVDPDEADLWRDQPVAALRRRHVEDALDTISRDHPHKAKRVLIGLRKLIAEGLRREWIEYDVTTRIDWSPPATSGWLAWGDEQIAAFEKRWPIGSKPRVAFALAAFLGNRRSDVAELRWDMIQTRTIVVDGKKRQVVGFQFIQFKNRKRNPIEIFLPFSPMLNECLAPLADRTGTILKKRDGAKYRHDTLSKYMRGWADAAGIGKGYSLHGLRKALGGWLDDAEATGGQGQDVLGHRSATVHDIYRVSRNRARNATIGMDRVTKLRHG